MRQWIDLDEATARNAKNIEVLFRGLNKNNPHKGIVGVQTEKEVICKHIQENFDNLKKMERIWVLLFQVFSLTEMFLTLIHIFLDD